MRNSLVAVGGLMALAGCATTPAYTPESSVVQVNLLAINDFHGNLDAPPRGGYIIDRANPRSNETKPAGGAPRLATAVREMSQRPNTIMVAAGDLIGASPLLSSLFHDEPTIESLSEMGLAIASVGNHEFDEGWQELKRMQDGGCHPKDGCRGPKPFAGATFEYLAASTYLDTGETLFPPYTVRAFDGVKVGFIGLTLEGTPEVITPAAAAGLRFADEAETVNALVPKLQADGVEAIVVLIHEGGFTTGGQDDCRGMSGAIAEIVPKFDDAVDVVITGHTNGIYICTVDGRLVTSAGAYGTRLTDIAMMIDRTSGDVVGARARDVIVAVDTYPEDPAQVQLIGEYRKLADPLMKREVGRTTVELTRSRGAHGESALGDLIGDAMLVAAQKQAPETQIAFMNPGGIRADIPMGDGVVTFNDIFAVQPFGNDLVVMTLTGAQIEAVLREQYQPTGNNILQVSEGFEFAWRQPAGQPIEIVPGSMKLGGVAMEADKTYRIVTNNFLATGGDGFASFRTGTSRVTVGGDVDALEAYVTANSPLTGGIKGRIRKVD
jgi:5'-nucleotidase